MQQAFVVDRLLLPTDENPAVTVQPGVNALDDPAARSMAPAALRLFLASGTDMGRVAAATGEETNCVGVVGFVGTEMLFASAHRSRSSNRDAPKSGFDKTPVMDVGPGDGRSACRARR
jgi:hypothetical protein